MIKVQMNIIMCCNNPECDSEEHFTGYFPLGASEETIVEEYIYEKRMTSWWYSRDAKKLFCSAYCGEAANLDH